MSTANNFILVEYNNVPYPAPYQPSIKEVAGHFDKEYISPTSTYSLHTEYSYGKRKFDTALISRFPALPDANKDGVPQLWKSIDWAAAFADFIIALTDTCPSPSIIEIHPPFNDYCTAEQFAERFQTFEKKLHDKYPSTAIVIENRSGSVYHGGKFLFGTASEIVRLCKTIRKYSLNLGIVLDFPQLLTAENINPLKFNTEKYDAAINAIVPHQNLIKGIHVWGKKKSANGRWVAHAGTLNTYFGGNNEIKNSFLGGIYRICGDGNKRFLVPEVNSGTDDPTNIINDLLGCMQ